MQHRRLPRVFSRLSSEGCSRNAISHGLAPCSVEREVDIVAIHGHAVAEAQTGAARVL